MGEYQTFGKCNEISLGTSPHNEKQENWMTKRERCGTVGNDKADELAKKNAHANSEEFAEIIPKDANNRPQLSGMTSQ